MKTEYYLPFISNSPPIHHSNVIMGLHHRCIILTSNFSLYSMSLTALIVRLCISNYPINYIYQKINKLRYKDRDIIKNKLKIKRIQKIKEITNILNINYKNSWNKKYKHNNYIKIPFNNKYNYDEVINKIRNVFPNKNIIFNVEPSLYKIIRNKEASHSII